MFILDTNAISDLRANKPKQDAGLRAWAASQPAAAQYLTTITVLELEMGVLGLERRDPTQGAMLRAWMTGVLASFRGRILPFSEKAALICAALNVPHLKPHRDSMSAAIALEHGFTVVTDNLADFAVPGLTTINPWTGRTPRKGK